MINSQELNALDKFLFNQQEATQYLIRYGHDPLLINKEITHSYDHIAKSDPLFIWFSAAVLGSHQIGKTLALRNNVVLEHCQDTLALTEGFSAGNRDIHNNVVALYYTYKDLGLKGLKNAVALDERNRYLSDEALKAFSIFDRIKTKSVEYAKSVNLSPNDSNVIHHILNSPENIKALKEASILLVQHEQKVVQPMYNEEYAGRKISAILNNTSYIEKLFANHLEIAGAKILDTYLPVPATDFSVLENRMDYFTQVFDEYFKVLAQPDGFEKLATQREMVVQTLGNEILSYNYPHQAFDKIIEPTSGFTFPDNFSFFRKNGKWEIAFDLKLPPFSVPAFEDLTPREMLRRAMGGELYEYLPKMPIQRDTFYYDSATKHLFYIEPYSGRSSTAPYPHSQGEWYTVSHIMIRKNLDQYYAENLPYRPNLANYDMYVVRMKKDYVGKGDLLSAVSKEMVDSDTLTWVLASLPHLLSKSTSDLALKKLTEVSDDSLASHDNLFSRLVQFKPLEMEEVISMSPSFNRIEKSGLPTLTGIELGLSATSPALEETSHHFFYLL